MVPQRTVSFKCRPMHMHHEHMDAYRKITKISPGAYFFPRRFLRGLFLEGLIRWEICFSKSARLILGGKFTSQNRLG